MKYEFVKSCSTDNMAFEWYKLMNQVGSRLSPDFKEPARAEFDDWKNEIIWKYIHGELRPKIVRNRKGTF